ncbi:type VII secretion-associated protein [Gordonia sp. CPCC 206044]|uniref:type VII secretion-associated protein n=1 Tax=Gordonia sp. CPCC 206044 TaxID=3140793 RepID=UPI003AF3F2E9
MVPAASRPTVVDLAYGRIRLSDGRTADVTELLDAVDAPTVATAAGAQVYTHQAWQRVWHDLGLPDIGPGGPLPVVIGHPSTWGRLRSSVFARSTAEMSVPVSVVPRAILIARSHTDIPMQRCAVVETSHLPNTPSDPARPAASTWDVARLRRSSSGWDFDSIDVLIPDADDIGARTEAIVDDTVEAVFVDGDDPAEVTRAIEMMSAYTVAGRVVAVDRELIRRYGWRTGRTQEPDGPVEMPAVLSDPGVQSRPRPWVRRSLWMAGAAVVAVALVAGVVGFLHRDDGESEAQRTVTLGRTDLVVPADWRESDLDADGQSDADAASRTVFVDREDGRRILVVQGEVRDDATLQSVATSLGNRIRQRGDDVVTEFSPSTRFVGRDVISYREAPGSGSAIRWYVLVESGLQVSIGCQAGNEGEPVDAECERAVSSVHIAPEG